MLRFNEFVKENNESFPWRNILPWRNPGSSPFNPYNIEPITNDPDFYDPADQPDSVPDPTYIPGLYWDTYESPPRWVYEPPPQGPSHWWQWDANRDVWIPTRNNPNYNRERKISPNAPLFAPPEKIFPFRPTVGNEIPFEFSSPVSNAQQNTVD